MSLLVFMRWYWQSAGLFQGGGFKRYFNRYVSANITVANGQDFVSRVRSGVDIDGRECVFPMYQSLLVELTFTNNNVLQKVRCCLSAKRRKLMLRS